VQTAYSPISSSSSFSYSSSSSSSSASYGYHLNIMVCGVLYTQLQWFIFLCDFLMGHHVFVYIYIYISWILHWCLWSHARHTYTIASWFWLRCGVEQFQQIFFLNMEIFRLFTSFFHLLMIIGTSPKYSLLEDATRLSYIIIIIIMVIICRRM